MWHRSTSVFFRFSFFPPNGFELLLPVLLIPLSSIMVSNRAFLLFVIWIYPFSPANPIILPIGSKTKLFWSPSFSSNKRICFVFNEWTQILVDFITRLILLDPFEPKIDFKPLSLDNLETLAISLTSKLL